MLAEDPPHFQHRQRMAMDGKVIGVDGNLRGGAVQLSVLSSDNSVARRIESEPRTIC